LNQQLNNQPKMRIPMKTWMNVAAVAVSAVMMCHGGAALAAEAAGPVPAGKTAKPSWPAEWQVFGPIPKTDSTVLDEKILAAIPKSIMPQVRADPGVPILE
jgi:hypothetical protein